jgi:biopolymer transport protein ExbB
MYANAFTDFIANEWYFAIPMFCMSLIAVALVVWRLLLNINGNTNLSEFLPLFQKKLDSEGVEGALRLCKSRTDIIPLRLFTAGLQTSKQGTAAMRRAMANEIELEIVPDLNFLLPSILAIAKIATMVGLLGTVISMIGTFQQIQDASRPKPQAVESSTEDSQGVAGHAGSIGLALFATALGLITAIPLVFAHVLFRAWMAKFEVRMKSAAQKFLVLMQAKGAGGGAPRPGVPAPAAVGAVPAPVNRPGEAPGYGQRK